MILQVTSSLPSFRPTRLKPGFNIILADRTKESTKKDSRNGLGKSTFIDIIHFCLGSRLEKGDRLAHPDLRGTTFSLELQLFGASLWVDRNTASPGTLVLRGDLRSLPSDCRTSRPFSKIPAKQWNNLLGQACFGIPEDSQRKYKPTFRSSISYFIRSGKDAYSDPFRHSREQLTWDIQVHNAFLLGLVWEDASDWQLLRDREKLLSQLKKAAQTGLMEDVFGSRGQLEAERVRLRGAIERTAGELKAFRVLEQYREVERQADLLAKRIKELSDKNVIDGRLLELYRGSVQEERKALAANVAAVYASAKVVFPERVTAKLSEAEAFHAQVVENRRQFLLAEMDRLASVIEKRKRDIEEAQQKQAHSLRLLDTHGALDQYTKLQEAHSEDIARLQEIESRLKNIRDFDEGRNKLKIDMATLEQRARKNYEAKVKDRDAAVSLFNANSETLYKAPGRLTIDVTERGFSYDVEIERKGSSGISNMEIFCYDLMLAERWSKRNRSPKLLIHDSDIYADVDDRQIALAMELAANKAKANSFQYICAFNSDKLPVAEFSPGFDVRSFARLTLTDHDEAGGLLGKRLRPLKTVGA